MTESQIRLVLFFTRGFSLKRWDSLGILERELLLYRRMAEAGIKVDLITYGTNEDLQYSKQLEPLGIHCNHLNLNRRLYHALLPMIHASVLKRASILKTNQIAGAEVALLAAMTFQKPLVARCGYMQSDFAARASGPNSWAARRARWLERLVFSSAAVVTVTTQQMADDVSRRIGRVRIAVIPNFVDTQLFRPSNCEKTYDVVCVARLSPQKNLAALVEAVRPLRIKTLLIGQGNLAKDLPQATELGSLFEWRSVVPNEELPFYLAHSHIFVLPSSHEGQPKALLEAMACGLPVVATNVPGTLEIIRHDETGILCDTSIEGIRAAINKVRRDQMLQERLGKSARLFAVENFSLEKVVAKELSLIEQILSQR